MKYFNSTKVAEARKKIRAPFTTGYNKPEVKFTYEKEKELERERNWGTSAAEWRKAELYDKMRGREYFRFW